MLEKEKIHEDIVLDEGEIMRISIKQSNHEDYDYELDFACDGDFDAMRAGVINICKEQFDLICIPKEKALGVLSISND